MSLKRGNEDLIPRELSRKISPSLLWFAGGPGKLLGFVLMAFCLYLPVAGTNRNAFLYLVAPWFGPSLAAIFFTFVPFRPYRGYATAGDMREVDPHDPVVMHLVELLKSDDARRHLWRQALIFSAILFLIAGALAIVFRNSLNYSPPSPQNRFMFPDNNVFWPGLAACCLGSYLALWSDYLAWGLTTWAKREGVHQAAKW